jgi:hypothetical protein
MSDVSIRRLISVVGYRQLAMAALLAIGTGGIQGTETSRTPTASLGFAVRFWATQSVEAAIGRYGSSTDPPTT